MKVQIMKASLFGRNSLIGNLASTSLYGTYLSGNLVVYHKTQKTLVSSRKEHAYLNINLLFVRSGEEILVVNSRISGHGGISITWVEENIRKTWLSLDADFLLAVVCYQCN
jgi:hypothetical protein